MKDKERVEAFYNGKISTPEGLFIDDVLAFTQDQFENNHHFIQWLFPIPTASFYNLQSPRLTKKAAKELGRQKEFREKMKESFQFMCKCYELTISYNNGDICIKPTSEFTGYWLTPNNHNHLRITRILECLSNIGLIDYAKAFLSCLLYLCNEYPACVTKRTITFWKNAVVD